MKIENLEKNLSRANTLAYFVPQSATRTKFLITFTPGPNVIKLFLFVNYGFS